MPQEGLHDRIERQLAAIMAADVVGFSRHMGENDVATVRRLDDLRARIIDPVVADHAGRIVKSMGDGLLIEFPSANDALGCALAIQRQIGADNAAAPDRPRLIFRVGLHVADVIREGDDIFGDGVNIAARLQAIAEPGGVCASATVLDQIHGGHRDLFADQGPQNLRNIIRPIHVFAIAAERIAGLPADPPRPLVAGPAGRRTGASLAVLPFRAPDGEESYFADGVVEDIIASLSLFRFLTVIARNSSFAFRHRPADPRSIARQLGVRYLADGGIRRAGAKVRATVELIDGATAATLWAGQFSAEAADIFDLQDDITRRIVTAIEPRVLEAEIEASRRKPAASLGAYDYYLRALPLRPIQTAEATEEALRLLREAIRLDPDFAPALALAAVCITKMHDQGYRTLTPVEIDDGVSFARRAIASDGSNATALCQAGHAILTLAGDVDLAHRWLLQATQVNPNLAEAWARLSWLKIRTGELELAVAYSDHAIMLSPLDPWILMHICAKGYALLFLGRAEEAVQCARRAIASVERPEMAYRLLVAALCRSGRGEDAKMAASDLMRMFPRFRISRWLARSAFTSPDQRNIITQALRCVGLPE